jgi:hypothetical protein
MSACVATDRIERGQKLVGNLLIMKATMNKVALHGGYPHETASWPAFNANSRTLDAYHKRIGIQFFRCVFGTLAVVSVFCVLGGCMASVMGGMIQFSPASQSGRVMYLGNAATDLGLIGVPLFSWLYTRCLKIRRVTP